MIYQLLEYIRRVVRREYRPVPACHRARLLHRRRAHLGHARAWGDVRVQASVGCARVHTEAEAEERRREDGGRGQSVLENHLAKVGSGSTSGRLSRAEARTWRPRVRAGMDVLR